MKTLVAVPCMEMLKTKFVDCLLKLPQDEYTIEFGVASLIYDTRNQFIDKAIAGSYERMFWIDSDMVFDAATMAYLNQDLDKGYDFVAGLAFKRRKPFTPVIFSELDIIKNPNNSLTPIAKTFKDYPKDCLFEVCGFGFGFVGMNVAGLQRVVDKYGKRLFSPYTCFGEDLSFCVRAKSAGEKLYCDSRAEVGHVGEYIYDSEMYERTRDDRKCEDCVEDND